MDISPKAKDYALQGISAGSGGYNIETARILQNDGYVSVIHTSMGDVFSITDAGKAFLARGGYMALEIEKERKHQELEAAKEREKQNRLQEIEIQRIVSLELMKKDHEFQAKQNRDNRRNNIVSGIIAAIISAIVALAIKYL